MFTHARHGGGLSAQTVLGVRLPLRTAPSACKPGTREAPHPQAGTRLRSWERVRPASLNCLILQKSRIRERRSCNEPPRTCKKRRSHKCNAQAGRTFSQRTSRKVWGPVSEDERCRITARCVGLRGITRCNNAGLRAAPMTNDTRDVRTQKASSEAKRGTGPYRMLRYQTESARERRKRCRPACPFFYSLGATKEIN